MAQSHDEPPSSPPPLPVEHGHPNRDPLTNEPGAHPVGVGMGAASAGAVGALLGAVAGPVGALVGSVVGAITGAMVGKETAESVNPTEPSASAGAGARVDEPGEASHPGEPNVMPVAPLGVVSNDASLSYTGGAGALAYLATHAGAEAADQDVPPEPTAELPPPPLRSVPPPGTRLRKIVLAGRTAPPPLEITAHTAYPEDNVRDAAYFRYLERQRAGRPGDELEDWATAEREVLRG